MIRDFESRLARLCARLYGIEDEPRRRRKQADWRPAYETEALFEDHSIAGTPVYPATNNGTQYTGTVDMSKFNRVQFLCVVGTLGGGANVLFQLQQSNNSNGQTNTNVAGGTATLPNSSQMTTIECRADQLTARYVQCAMIVNTQASTDMCIPLASETRQHPQSSDDGSVQTRVKV